MIVNYNFKSAGEYISPVCSVCDIVTDLVVCGSGNGETVDWSNDENGF